MSSKRMTDEEFARHIDKQQKESGWRGAYAAAVDEADRARASEETKDATIKALADALDRFGRHFSGCLTKKNPGCVCGLDSALRLGGRIP